MNIIKIYKINNKLMTEFIHHFLMHLIDNINII